jgi:diguanylate cyclase (GGDEF)-like protein/PAS domain S-box-containing protein
MDLNSKAAEKLTDEVKFLQIRITELEKSEARHRLADELLHKSELQQKAILNNIPDMVWLKDRDSRFIAVNEAFGAACGLKPEKIVGKTDLDIWPRDLADRYRADDKEVMKSGQRKCVDEPLSDKEGKIQWLETIKTPFYNDKGEVIGTIGIARDITERKKYEERLREAKAELEIRVKVRTADLSKINEDYKKEINETKKLSARLLENENFLSSVFFSIQDGISILDKDMNVIRVNSVIEKWFDYSMPLVGKKCYNAYHCANEPCVCCPSRKALQTGSAAYELIPKRDKNGNIIGWFDIFAFPLHREGSNEIIGSIEYARDVTERKKIDEQIANSEFRFRELFNNISSGVAVYSAENNGSDFVFMDLNRAAEKIERIKKEDVIGKNVIDVFPSIKETGLLDIFKKVWKTGQPLTHPSAYYKNKMAPGWRENFVYRLPTGEIVAVYEDVTLRKQAELDLLKSNERLKESALIDSHTGLYNHRYLEDVIEAEFHRARRYAHSLAIIMLDIDYFKSVNDLYGHQFGDYVIKQFAEQIKKMVRRYDIVVRFGGEEFIIISPGIDRNQAFVLSQRILEALNLYNFGNRQHKVKLKISIGVVSYPEDRAKNGMDLVNSVDQVLAEAKESGGNRVYLLTDIKREDKGKLNGKNRAFNVKVLEGKIDKLNRRANQSLTEAILAFAKTIELKDHYTGEHVEITGHYATMIANRIGLPKEEIELIRQASILHDLGKIGISEKILLKKSKLTKKEFEEIKKHPQIGADILRPIHFLRGLIPIIFYHHERWDGKGYPTCIKGEEIPVGARILALADVYQALTSDRPYRKAYPKARAIKIIKEGSGTQFDPRLTGIFLKILQEKE